MKIQSAALLAAAVSVASTLTSFAATSHESGVGIRLPEPPSPTEPRPLVGPLLDPEAGPARSPHEPAPVVARPVSGAGYLIVTDGPLVGQFERLAAWKRRQGTPAEVRTLASILAAHPEGRDDAERIRLAIRDAYAQGTRWVLLGGDTEVVPTRIAHSLFFAALDPAYADYPSDFYFACLDGDWNADGDGVIGETNWFSPSPDQLDLVPEVFVGRAPVRTVAEARVFVEKTIDFGEGRAVPSTRQTLFMAEVLFPKPWHPGDFVTLDFAEIVDQVHRNPPGPGFDPVRLFENHADPSYLPGALPENRAAALDQLGRGYPMTFFLGGGSFDEMSVGNERLDRAAVGSLGNRQALTHLFHLSAFTHEITRDCIAETFLRDPDGGAVTSMGLTNLGFATIGAFGFREYVRLWLTGEARTAGELAALHRRFGSPEYKTGALLLGDPQLPIVPEAPAQPVGRETMLEDGAAAEAVLAEFASHPNPARNHVTLEVDLGSFTRTQPLRAAVFDLSGRRVRALDGVVRGGRWKATWNLRDQSGRRVDEGVYFVSVHLGDAKRVSRLLVVR